MRICRSLLLTISLVFPCSFFGQSTNAALTGVVDDPSKAVIAAAQITAINTETGVKSSTTTNNSGVYVLPGLIPGTYRIEVDKQGFKGIIQPGLVLHVQDVVQLNFHMALGSMTETVTVEANGVNINTTDATVSTVVDRNFVEDMPLNGRSFQDLIRLTPGVVTNSPQTQATLGYTGEFSVNGQRTESNYYSVDGVSANLAAIPSSPSSIAASGSLPASTALGTTQGLVSVEALEQFRVQSSTYSAEFGRNPGGQFAFATRSGTNDWHGAIFDYLRNDVFDANDWFNNFFGQAKPAVRQNDFGATLGGPVQIPRLYSGINRTFFFFSYEGLRLLQPQPAVINYVPDANMRKSAPSALQAVLNAFPSPTPGTPDLSDGLGEFIGTWSNPSSINSYSIRLDQAIGQKAKLFFRFSDTSSSSDTRGSGDGVSPANVFRSSYSTRTFTGGTSILFSSRVGNDFRLNYSSNETITSTASVGGFGGGHSVDLFQLQGINRAASPNPEVLFGLLFPSQFPVLSQLRNQGYQRQWNFVDTVGVTLGRHLLKIGGDYRRLSPYGFPVNPYAQYFYFDANSVQTNSPSTDVIANAAAYPLYLNFSAFIEDEWRATSRLSLSMGLRWDVNPAPSVTRGNQAYTVEGSSPSTLVLAPQGTPLWKTTWYNFAPRLGAAYVLRNAPGWETVVRGGGGVFFDTGQQLGSLGFVGVGFSAIGFPTEGFPVPPSELIVPIINPPVAPYVGSNVVAFAPHLQLPYTLQWNGSMEQTFGKSQALTLSYVGAHGVRLLETSELNLIAVNPNFSQVSLVRNGLTSDYNALQVSYQRRLSGGLEALASYTWSHSIDYGSTYRTLPYIRGNSDFDVRHNFSAAVSYSLPNFFDNRFADALSRSWSLDGRLSIRTGFPITLDGLQQIDPLTGQTYNSGLDVVPGEQFYLYGSQCTAVFGNPCIGGRSINPGAFAVPPTGQVGNAPRNFVRGFGAWQTDIAVRREFPLHERLMLQFRAEAFNIFNHPNFGHINPNYCPAGAGCTFGEATSTLAQSLGGLSPLYQTGGPRSMQISLKVTF